MTDEKITVTEVYRLVERVERKVDETNAYAHERAHQLNGMIGKIEVQTALLAAKDVELAADIAAVNARVDNVYRNAAWLATSIGGLVTAIGQLVPWPWKK